MGEPEPRHDPDPSLAAGQPLLAFVHIPRTGGGTVKSAISKNYSRMQAPGNYQKGPEATRRAVERMGTDLKGKKVVGDHVPYGLYRRYLPAETRYITILRDPVDRVLSHYHFNAQAGKSPGSAGSKKLRIIWEMLLNNERLERPGGEQESDIVLEDDAEFSLAEGLRRRICIYDNFMTRFLWGGESLFGELPPHAVDRAKENISSFFFVGVRERLDDSVILLGRKLGVGLMPYHLRHVSQRRPPLEETSDELRALVAEHNAFDVELYRFARERFETTAPDPGELAGEVDELRRLSVAVTAEGEAHKATKGERVTRKREAREAREAKRAAVRNERAASKASKKPRRGGRKPRNRRPNPSEPSA